MTKAELLAELEGVPDDTEIHFSYNYGDHWRTQVAPKVRRVRMGLVKWSDYHQMDKVIRGDMDEDEDTGLEGAGADVVIILS